MPCAFPENVAAGDRVSILKEQAATTDLTPGFPAGAEFPRDLPISQAIFSLACLFG
jgi:hypothetical protein